MNETIDQQWYGEFRSTLDSKFRSHLLPLGQIFSPILKKDFKYNFSSRELNDFDIASAIFLWRDLPKFKEVMDEQIAMGKAKQDDYNLRTYLNRLAHISLSNNGIPDEQADMYIDSKVSSYIDFMGENYSLAQTLFRDLYQQ